MKVIKTSRKYKTEELILKNKIMAFGLSDEYCHLMRLDKEETDELENYLVDEDDNNSEKLLLSSISKIVLYSSSIFSELRNEIQ